MLFKIKKKNKKIKGANTLTCVLYSKLPISLTSLIPTTNIDGKVNGKF
jgi:hypothetical protein